MLWQVCSAKYICTQVGRERPSGALVLMPVCPNSAEDRLVYATNLTADD